MSLSLSVCVILIVCVQGHVGPSCHPCAAGTYSDLEGALTNAECRPCAQGTQAREEVSIFMLECQFEDDDDDDDDKSAQAHKNTRACMPFAVMFFISTFVVCIRVSLIAVC